MIYLLDHQLTDYSHSKYMTDIIKDHSSVEVAIVEVPVDPGYSDLYKIVKKLKTVVGSRDIILVPWAVDGDDKLDDLFNDLAEKCPVVVAAGNSSTAIDNYSPSRASEVITVGCLNKSGVKASLSNYSSNKELKWVPGTNYSVGWMNGSGTSISAAVYAAFLAESMEKGDPGLVDILIAQFKEKVLKELNT